MATTSASLQQLCVPSSVTANARSSSYRRNATVSLPSVSRPCSLSFSASFSTSLPVISSVRQTQVEAARPLILAMADKKDKKQVKKKVDSAVKRAKQAEVRRVYNKSRKTEMSTRMKKVFKALEELRKSPEAKEEDLVQIEKLIGEAYTIIDKSVKVGTIHKNKGARRKSRLARAKRDLSIALGWYKPVDANLHSA